MSNRKGWCKSVLQLMARSFAMLFACAVAASAAFAQVDRGRADPWSDVKKYYYDAVKYAEQNNRDAALTAVVDMTKALNAIQTFSDSAPRALNDGNVRELASKGQKFLDSLVQFRDSAKNLWEQLKKVGESYSSELSTFKSRYETFAGNFNDFWTDLYKAGQALKASCAECVR